MANSTREMHSQRRDTIKRNPVRWNCWRADHKEQVIFFAGYPGRRFVRIRRTAFGVPTTAMLAGDFTAFASPACNGGRQITLSAVREQPHRPRSVQQAGGSSRNANQLPPHALDDAATQSSAFRVVKTDHMIHWAASTINLCRVTRYSAGICSIASEVPPSLRHRSQRAQFAGTMERV